MRAPLPDNEAARLQALHRLQILDTPPEAAFDRLTRLASRLFRVPAAQISLVDQDRQWLKSSFGPLSGPSSAQRPREVSACAHAILQEQVLVVPDATLDARFADNALVTAEGGLRFYAGAPLKTREGFNVGTLCLLDTQPRSLSAAEAATLADLASVVVDELELRLAAQLLSEEIKERERSQAQAAAREERTRSIIEAAHDAFVSMDAGGRIIDWNRRAEETFGWSRDQALGRLLSETIIPPRYRSAHQLGLHKYLQTGEGPVLNTSIEISALHHDGREFPIELSITPVRLEHETLFTAFVRDISERKRVEEELRESQRFAESIAEHSTSIIYVFDLRTLTNAYSNRNVAEFLGYSPAQIEAMGTNFLPTIVHPEDLPSLMSRREELKALGEGQVIEFEMRFRHADGSWRWLWNRELVFKREQNGVPIQILGTAQDITERKQAAQAIWESERRFAAFMRYVPGVAFMKDTQGRYAYVNESFEQLFGLKLEYLRGKTDEEVWPPETAAQFKANDAEAMGRKQAVQIVETVPHADGAHFWLSSKFPILDDQGDVVMLAAVAIDITEKERAAHDLKEFTRRLERSNRELQDFSYVASHDLQEPLRKIRAFGDRLSTKHGASLDASGREYVRFMQEAAARMQTLIEDLLSYSRVTTQAKAFTRVDLAQVARQVLEDLELRVEQSGGQVEVGALPVIEADETQMRQLLQNLIGNALKFHRSNVPPRVQVEQAEQVEAGSGDNEMCELVVRDNGIGFEEKYLDRIFQPFQRLHERETYEGTGIGLAICRKIAERHNGSITARSAPGSGTEFHVSLPLKQSVEASVEASGATTSGKPGVL